MRGTGTQGRIIEVTTTSYVIELNSPKGGRQWKVSQLQFDADTTLCDCPPVLATKFDEGPLR